MEGNAIVDIPIEKLKKSPLNPRKKLEHMEELTDTVIESGIDDEITVVAKDGMYEVISGLRRFEASKNAELTSVPCKIKTFPNDVEASLYIAREDVQKEELTPYERGLHFRNLMNMGLKRSEIASKIGKTDSYVKDYLEIADGLDPEVGEKVSVRTDIKTISKEKAKNLSRLDKSIQKALAERVESEGMDAPKVRKRANDIKDIQALINEVKDPKLKKELTEDYLDDPAVLITTEVKTVQERIFGPKPEDTYEEMHETTVGYMEKKSTVTEQSVDGTTGDFIIKGKYLKESERPIQ